jgi:hypothetical protein
MSLQLNENEIEYLIVVINDDIIGYLIAVIDDGTIEEPCGNPEFLNKDKRNKLLRKIEDIKC